MKNLMNIPYELTLFFANRGSLQKRFFVEIANKKDLTSKKRSKIIDFIVHSYRIKGLKDVNKQNIDEINIMNTSFQISLADYGKDSVDIRTSMYNDCQEILVRIQSEEIDTKFFGKPVYTYIELKNFLNVINESKNINDGDIQGEYYIGIGLGYNNSTFIHLDDPTNKLLEESKKVGRLIGTKNNTSKWIPGYKYALNPTDYVIYLGKVNFPYYINTNYRFSRKIIELFSDFFNYNSIGDKITSELNLCISSDYLNNHEDIKNLFVENKKLKIEDVIRNLLTLDHVKDSYNCISFIKETAKKGVEIEKCIEVDNNFDLGNFILSIINYHLNNFDLDHLNNEPIDILRSSCIPELRLINFNYDYFLANNDKLKKVILNKLFELLLLEAKGYKNSSVDYIFTNCSNYFYLSVYILKKLKDPFGITDEYIKEMIDSKLKSINGNN